MDQRSFVRAAAGAALAECVYVRDDGEVDATVVVPLAEGEGVVVALPYAQRALAEALAGAEAVGLVCSDRRLALAGWQPVAAVGRVSLELDPDGERFRAGLVEEEVRKHPPSKLLANSLMDRREHWWFMSRLLCRFDVTSVQEVAARSEPAQGVLAWHAAEGLRIDTVDADPLGERDLRARSLGGEVLAGASDPACLLRHDCSLPDLERRSTLVERGRLEGDVLRVHERDGALDLPEPPGLVTRVRRHRAFAKACRRELARERVEP